MPKFNIKSSFPKNGKYKIKLFFTESKAWEVVTSSDNFFEMVMSEKQFKDDMFLQSDYYYNGNYSDVRLAY